MRNAIVSKLIAVSSLCVMFSFGTVPPTANAQIAQSTVPQVGYFRTFNNFYRGEFRASQRDFRGSARSGYIGVEGPWMDHICYHTMVAECMFQMGDVNGALEQYNSALGVFVANGAWFTRVDFPATVNDEASTVNASRINWGTTSRTTRIGRYPDSFSVMIGTLEGINRNGVVQRAELKPLDLVEVMRCTTLAMRRRAEILGPTASYDRVTDQMIDALEGSGLPATHWARPWVNIPIAIGLASDGEVERAAALLSDSIQIGKTFDHPLSAVAMLELGKIYFNAEKYDQAATLFFEATLSGAVFEQHDVIEEAFRWGTKTHLAQKKPGLYPPLESALVWAGRNGSHQLRVSLELQLAECHLASGNSGGAAASLARASKLAARNDIGVSPLGAQKAYLAAHLNFQQGKFSNGVSELAVCMELQKAHSRWLYQIQLADALATRGELNERAAMDVMTGLLRDPTSTDWRTEPMDSMSVLLIAHPIALEHWFELALSRRSFDEAIEIADKIRRQRFFNSLPLGGRLMSLRWVLEAPRDAISAEALAQRQEFLLRYPNYATVAAQSKTAVDELRTLPLIPDPKSNERQTQKKLLTALDRSSAAQEAALADIAMRREPADIVFPPVHKTSDVQGKMKDGDVLISYFATSNSVYLFRVTRGDYSVQRLGNTASIRNLLSKLLRGIGNLDRNMSLDEENLANVEWKEDAKKLRELVLPDVKEESWAECKELIVVPDGILWYLPFEILPISDAEDSEMFVDRFQVRYLPTTSLTVPDGRPNPPRGTTAVVTGKLYPKDEPEVALESFELLQAADPDAVQIEMTLPGPSALLATRIDRLVVWDDIADPKGSVYNLAPMNIDQGKPGSDLSSWAALPFGGTEQIVMPGFHTAAESGQAMRNANGDELFFATIAMMASGTRTALLSRWRTGGRSSYELTREFVKELDERPAVDAWSRALDLSWRSEIAPELEPRLKELPAETKLDAKHPFFWSGYMLIDTGVR